MTKPNDGGLYSEYWTVRDEFAAKALQMVMRGSLIFNPNGQVKTAYDYADAMLKERESSR